MLETMMKLEKTLADTRRAAADAEAAYVLAEQEFRRDPSNVNKALRLTDCMGNWTVAARTVERARRACDEFVRVCDTMARLP